MNSKISTATTATKVVSTESAITEAGDGAVGQEPVLLPGTLGSYGAHDKTSHHISARHQR